MAGSDPPCDGVVAHPKGRCVDLPKRPTNVRLMNAIEDLLVTIGTGKASR